MELCNVCYKTIHTRHTDPEEWVGDLVKNSIEYGAESIYKLQLENTSPKVRCPQVPLRKPSFSPTNMTHLDLCHHRKVL